MESYRRVATAMTQTTLIGGLGLAVFSFSTFTPTQRFGMMMLTLLFAALIGDLIMLPALLAGPLGRFFEPRRDRKNSGGAPSPEGSSETSPAEPAESRPAAPPAPHQPVPPTGSSEAGGGAILRRDRRHG